MSSAKWRHMRLTVKPYGPCNKSRSLNWEAIFTTRTERLVSRIFKESIERQRHRWFPTEPTKGVRKKLVAKLERKLTWKRIVNGREPEHGRQRASFTVLGKSTELIVKSSECIPSMNTQ